MPAFVRRVVLAFFAVALATTPSAYAAFPGANGRIAFHSNMDGDYDIYSVNPDGTGFLNLTNTPELEQYPAWSPDGTRLAFTGCPDPTECIPRIYTMNADGTDRVNTGLIGTTPAWSPDGTKLVYGDALRVANADGTGDTAIAPTPAEPLGMLVTFPAWSPDGTRFAYSGSLNPGNGGPFEIFTVKADGTDKRRLTFDAREVSPGQGSLIDNYDPNWSPDATKLVYWRPDGSGGAVVVDLYTINADGTGRTRLTQTAGLNEEDPAWSPDGRKIAFVGCCPSGGIYEIFQMNADATGVTQITDDDQVRDDESPDWQPLPPGRYVRPKGASPFRVSLVPAYDACTTPNSTHGSPLSSSACSPPVPTSTSVTVGTMDANGADANSQASIRLTVEAGVRGPPEDSDVLISASVTDVRCLPGTSTCGNANTVGGADYVGELRANLDVRITDRYNEANGTEPVGATVVDLPFPFFFECANTSSTDEGAVCSSETSADAVVPENATDGKRAIWQLAQAHVTDGGPDGTFNTAPNTTFLRQGIFVP